MAYQLKSKRTDGLPQYSVNEFCMLYGDSIRNQILCYFLECDGSNEPLSAVISLTGLSKPTVYKTVAQLVAQGLLLPSRKFKKMQLYTLNPTSDQANILRRQFNNALNSVSSKYNPVQIEIKKLSKKQTLEKEDIKNLLKIAINSLD